MNSVYGNRLHIGRKLNNYSPDIYIPDIQVIGEVKYSCLNNTYNRVLHIRKKYKKVVCNYAKVFPDCTRVLFIVLENSGDKDVQYLSKGIGKYVSEGQLHALYIMDMNTGLVICHGDDVFGLTVEKSKLPKQQTFFEKLLAFLFS